MKLYFHRAMIYVMARVWPNLFLRYFDDYWKRYSVEFLSKVKTGGIGVKEAMKRAVKDIKEGRVTKVKDLDKFFKEL